MSKQTEALKLALEALMEATKIHASSCKCSVCRAVIIVQKALAEQPAPQQEPVAWMFTDKEGTEFFEQHEDWDGRWTPLYTSPPASKPWLGLTFKEKKEIERLSVYVERAIRHTEAKLKAKNT